jgi:hypothetical protein
MTTSKCFADDGLVPDVVARAPEHTVEVSARLHARCSICAQVRYASGAAVQLGNDLTPTEVKDHPNHIGWQGADANSLYTICMTGTNSVTGTHTHTPL